MKKNINNAQIKPRKKAKVWQITIITIIVVAVLTAIGVTAYLLTAEEPPVKPPIIKEDTVEVEPFNILFLGVDAGDGNTRTDTMILAHVDQQNKVINMISVPRDTKIADGYGRSMKINAAHALGGPERAVTEVENLLGVTIPYYMKVDFEGFRNVIDILGGVDVNVEKSLHYTDRAGDTYINIDAGYQKLDGKQSLDYVRFRHDPLGDLGRIARQQNFIQALLSEMLKPENVLKWPAMMKEAWSHFDTNITYSEMGEFVKMIKTMAGAKVEMCTLPGDARYIDGISYFLVYPEETAQLIDEKVNHVQASGESAMPPTSTCRVAVLNGTGVGGTAKKYADALRQEGFNVVKVDNAPSSDYQENAIVRHDTGLHIGLTQKISDTIGGGSVNDGNSDPAVDVTVIIGKNALR